MIQSRDWAGRPQRSFSLRDTTDAIHRRVQPWLRRTYGEQQGGLLGSILQTGTDMVPGVGDMLAVDDIKTAAENNDRVGVGLGLLAAAPLVPGFRGAARGARRGRGLLSTQPADGASYRVVDSQNLAPTDTPESLRAQGYEIDPATNTWARVVGREPAPQQYPIRAYHGSPHDFDRFSLDKIGTGEGAQAYGHGLYFAESEDVARSYRDALQNSALSLGGNVVADNPRLARLAKAYPSVDSAMQGARNRLLSAEERLRSATDDLDRMLAEADVREVRAELADLEPYQGQWFDHVPTGRMYEVGINAHPDTFLDWDAPLSEQPEIVQRALPDLAHPEWLQRRNNAERLADGTLTGPGVYHAPLSLDQRSAVRATQAWRDAGINGIRYLDGNSRGAGQGSRNYVVFDDRLVNILRKYGIGGLGFGAGSAAFGGGLLNQQTEPTGL